MMFRRAKAALLGSAGPILDFVYPPRCLGCGEPVQSDDVVCAACFADMIAFPFTPEHSQIHLRSLHAPVHAQAMYVGFQYEHEGCIERCLHAMKYNGLHRVGRWLGRILGERLMEAGSGEDAAVLIPIPLHHVKLVERGFNQSEAICRGVQEETGWEVMPDAIIRTRYTDSQAASRLDIDRRRANVEGVFRVNPKRLESLRGRRVFVVDDLITTGATIGSCTLVLSENGVRDISLLAVARPARETDLKSGSTEESKG